MTKIIIGDALTELKKLPENSVQLCVTSPPYFGLRNYGVDGQVGLEKTPAEYVQTMVDIFREVRRLLRPDGTLWLNLGDSYAGSWGNYGGKNRGHGTQRPIVNGSQAPNPAWDDRDNVIPAAARPADGLKCKDLIGIPWRVALALQADGWWLRAACPWVKRNGMPESTRSRPTQVVEYLFMLTKSESCYYDPESVKVEASDSYKNDGRWKTGPTPENEKSGYEESGARNPKRVHSVFNGEAKTKRLRRATDWFFESMMLDQDGEPAAFLVNTKPYRGAHFATFPSELIRPCIRSGSKPGDTVLDPFGGSGTTGMVAEQEGRNSILIELNPEYEKLIQERIQTPVKTKSKITLDELGLFK